MSEHWKTVKCCEDYEVSDLGNIRLRGYTKVYEDGSSRWVDPQSVTIVQNPKGVKLVHINGREEIVHRLVATEFLENPNNLPLVEHINRDQSDNRVENLRWVSRSDCRNSHVDRRVQEFGTSVGRRVECLETGQIFASYRAGAIYFHMSYDAFVNRVHNEKPIQGFHLVETQKSPNVPAKDLLIGFKKS